MDTPPLTQPKFDQDVHVTLSVTLFTPAIWRIASYSLFTLLPLVTLSYRHSKKLIPHFLVVSIRERNVSNAFVPSDVIVCKLTSLFLTCALVPLSDSLLWSGILGYFNTRSNFSFFRLLPAWIQQRAWWKARWSNYGASSVTRIWTTGHLSWLWYQVIPAASLILLWIASIFLLFVGR